MRYVFVPACCLGLMTGSGAVGPEISLASLPHTVEQRVAPAADIDAASMETSDSSAQAAAALAVTGYADQYEIPDPISEPVPTSPRPLKPIVKPIIPRTRAEICDTLTEAAQRNNLPAPFFIRLLYQESGFRPGTVSPAGAEGVAQFMPETAADRGLDNPYDPVQAIAAAAGLLRDLARRFGNLGLAAAAYNAGPGRIDAWLAKKGRLPQETKDYVKTITGRPAEGWMAVERGSPAVKLQRRAPCQQAAGLLAWDGPDRIPLPPTREVAHKVAPPAKPDEKAKLAATKDETKAAKHKDREATADKSKHRHVHVSER